MIYGCTEIHKPGVCWPTINVATLACDMGQQLSRRISPPHSVVAGSISGRGDHDKYFRWDLETVVQMIRISSALLSEFTGNLIHNIIPLFKKYIYKMLSPFLSTIIKNSGDLLDKIKKCQLETLTFSLHLSLSLSVCLSLTHTYMYIYIYIYIYICVCVCVCVC